MSKTDSLLRLLAILRFSVPSNSSRTLNATQAYDVTSIGITLASAIGTLLDKDVAVKADAGYPQKVSAGLSLTGLGPAQTGDTAAAGKKKQVGSFAPHATVTLWAQPTGTEVFGKKETGNCSNNYTTCGTGSYPHCCDILFGAPNTLIFGSTIFGSTSNGGTAPFELLNKSKATNPNTTFYGAITVGTGDYKKWQGKYAVLKINTVTGKGVLRIYDDA